MDVALRDELQEKTEQALDADDWAAVERLWQPWIDQGDAEAEFQCAYHYLWYPSHDDQATDDRMKALLKMAAAKDHPDAVWLMATSRWGPDETDPEYRRLILHAGQLGSVNAARALGVAYAIGEWAGPMDLAEAARWYRIAAERGEVESMYDLGFMLLLGEGGPANVPEGLDWLEKAGELGSESAFRLLDDCYGNGYCGVPVDLEKAAYWRSQIKETESSYSPGSIQSLSIAGPLSKELRKQLLDIDGVLSCGTGPSVNGLCVFYDANRISPEALAERIRSANV